MTGPAAGGDATTWLARVAAHPVGRLATQREDGRIDLVPFVYAWLPGPGPFGQLVSAVDHKPKRRADLRRFTNIAANPTVTVLVDHYDDDWSQLWWVRLRGRGRQAVTSEEAEAIAALTAKYAPYRERQPAGAVLVIQIDAVQGWSAAPLRPADREG